MREAVDDSISLDSQVELQGQFDLAAYAALRAFNSAAWPPGMADWLKAAIEARAADIREAAKDSLILDELSEPGAREKRRRENGEATETQIGLILQEQQHEREEWLKSSVTVAGTTMTGAEWQDLSERLREDDDFRDRLMQLFIARGMSKEEAEARVERVAEVAEIAAIPESQRTDEQKQTMKKAEADPTFKEDIRDAAQVAGKDNAPATSSEFNDRFTQAAEGASIAAPQAAAAPQAERQVTATIGAGL